MQSGLLGLGRAFCAFSAGMAVCVHADRILLSRDDAGRLEAIAPVWAEQCGQKKRAEMFPCPHISRMDALPDAAVPAERRWVCCTRQREEVLRAVPALLCSPRDRAMATGKAEGPAVPDLLAEVPP